MFGLPQKRDAVSRSVTYGTLDAPTAQENRAVNWQVLTGMCLIGVPSLVAVGATAIVNADFCAYLSGSAGNIPAIEHGGLALAFTGLLAGLPIAIERLRDESVTKYARGLWFGVIGLSAIASLADVAISPVAKGPTSHMVRSNNGSLNDKLESAQRALNAIPPHRGLQAAYKAWNEVRAENWDVWEETNECRDIRFNFEAATCNNLNRLGAEYWNARKADDLKKTIAGLRAQMASQPLIAVADAAPETSLADTAKTRLLWLILACLRLVTASVGMWIATRYIASQLTGRTEFPHVLPSQPSSIEAFDHPDTDQEAAYRMWIERCISIRPGSRVKAADAFTHYERFCAENGLPALSQKSFGINLTEFAKQNGGHKSTANGNIYNGIAILTPTPEKISTLME